MVLALSFSPGHLHPLLVHLPIGFLYLVGILVLASLWKRTDAYRPAITLSLGVATLAAVLAIVSGWLMAGDGGYGEATLSRHKWLGIATASVTLLLWVLARMQLRSRKLLAVITLVALVLLTLTGHYGGQMTHGADFLFAPEKNTPTLASVEEAVLYSDVIAPMLQTKCAACHNGQKQKGGLDVTTYAALRKGGTSGPVLERSEEALPELLRRIHLPESDEQHMPPAGKTALTPDEMDLLMWWTDHDACETCLASALPEFTQFESAIQAVSFTRAPNQGASEAQLAALRENDVDISWSSEDGASLGISLEFRPEIEDDALDAMEEVQAHVGYLNVAGSALPEGFFGLVAEMPNLRRLMLQNSTVTDAQLGELEAHPSLEVLNLYGTSISDESLSVLASLEKLERIYTWQSRLTSKALQTLQDQQPNVHIIGQAETDLFPASELKPPLIETENTLFETATEVVLSSTIPNCTIRYTTDGTAPSAQSQVYRAPLNIQSTQRIQAIAEKDGWVTSQPANLQLFKAGVPAQTVRLKQAPAEAYSAKGPQTLIDRHYGEPGVMNGNWLGYQGKHLTAELEYAEPRSMGSVYISALSNPGSWVFFPKAATVWTSQDGKRYQKAGTASYDTRQRFGEELDCFEVSFERHTARFVKVEVQSIRRNPDWHPSPGEKAWLFVDEVFVE